MDSHYKQLASKRFHDLTVLQNNFDEYTASSRELEEELEGELGRAEGKISELQNQKLQLQLELEDVRERSGGALQELVSIQTELERLREAKSKLESVKQALEQENDELQNRERIAKVRLAPCLLIAKITPLMAGSMALCRQARMICDTSWRKP